LECAHAALVIFLMTQPNLFVKDDIIVDSKCCARIPGRGMFLRDAAYQYLREDVEMFGHLFCEVSFELWFNTLLIATCTIDLF
jgi:hypothetical protein